MRKVKKCYVERAEFSLKNQQCLIVSYNFLEKGLNRLVVQNLGKEVKVEASGRSRFLLEKGKKGPHTCDFFISNPDTKTFLEDIIDGRFWGQFTFRELCEYQKNPALNKELGKLIKKLVDEFESRAAKECNALVKKFYPKSRV